MACDQPLSMFKLGSLVRYQKPNHWPSNDTEIVPVACRKCLSCRLSKAAQWGVRCHHETTLHRRSSFLTLTYADEHLPANRDECEAEAERLGREHRGLWYPDVQLFMKRLRWKLAQRGIYVRSVIAGEYGELRQRPHYHVMLFGYRPDYDDMQIVGKGKNKESEYYRYRPLELEFIWGKGRVDLMDANFNTGAYLGRYTAKKAANGLDEEAYYSRICEKHGDEYQAPKEFVRASSGGGKNKSGNGAIAYPWISKPENLESVYAEDKVPVGRRTFRPPEQYDHHLKSVDETRYWDVRKKREEYAQAQWLSLGENDKDRSVRQAEMHAARGLIRSQQYAKQRRALA